MAGEGGEESRTLERTPTWAFAIVCAVLIVISIIFEHTLRLLTKFFRKRRKSLYQALHKIKSELMLFGFLSLLITVSKEPISKICIPRGAADVFLPCEDELSSAIDEENICDEQGKVSLLSEKGVNELQVLIFALAFYHVVSCVLTFGLGMLKIFALHLMTFGGILDMIPNLVNKFNLYDIKLRVNFSIIEDKMYEAADPTLWQMRRWKAWEDETRTLEYQTSHDPRRFRLTKQTTFAQRHLRFWSEHPLLRWPVCFLRQFIGSVSKTDYITLRHGFIMAHLAEGSEFNFQRYLERALDKDLEVVVGTSIWIWTFSVFCIFFSAHGFHSYLWLPFVPLVMILVVGTKLQVIITKMCLESRDRGAVIVGTLIVKPHDNLFWFSRPQLLLYLMHFILFQNSFQMAFFSWTWYKFGRRSCFHRKTDDFVIRIVVGTLVQYLCGYVTLPLYALVTQMGSTMKEAAFTEQVIVALSRWHKTAKGKFKTNMMSNSSDVSVSVSTSSSSRREAFQLAEFDYPSQEHLSVDVTDESDEGSLEVIELRNQQE